MGFDQFTGDVQHRLELPGTGGTLFAVVDAGGSESARSVEAVAGEGI